MEHLFSVRYILGLQSLVVIIFLDHVQLVVLYLFSVIIEIILYSVDLLLLQDRKSLKQVHPFRIGLPQNEMHGCRSE